MLKIIIYFIAIIEVSFCQFNTDISSLIASVGSCKGRCGDSSFRPCACIQGCGSLCCKDYAQYCPVNQINNILNGGSISSFSDLNELLSNPNIQVVSIGGTPIQNQNENQNSGVSRIFCSSPGPIANGRHSGTKSLYSMNSVITYSCDGGYTLEGTAVRKCSLDVTQILVGKPRVKWASPEPYCKRSTPEFCDPRDCGFPLCFIGSNCPAHPNAKCKPSYCDCKEIYEVNGQVVNCNAPSCNPRNCGIVSLCSRPFCPAYPNAQCKPSYCECKEIYEVNGREVNCLEQPSPRPCDPRFCSSLCSRTAYCPAYPDAVCRPSYCDCSEIYEVNGREVNCNDRPQSCDPRNCGSTDLCSGAFCFSYPQALCRPSFCDCKPIFELNGREVDCDGNGGSNGQDESQSCDPRRCGSTDLCSGAFCLSYPQALCRPSFCDCKPIFELNGREVNCDGGGGSNGQDESQSCDPRRCGSTDLCSGIFCLSYPQALCRPSFCDCKPIFELNGREVNCDGGGGSNGQDESQSCDPRRCGSTDLCSGTFCLSYPQALCRPSFCDCKPIFELNGQEVDCNGGGNGQDESQSCDPRRCGSTDLCSGTFCLSYPQALCRPSFCDCKPIFELNGREVNCDRGGGGQVFNIDPCRNNNCDKNADCFTTGQIGFTCRCKSNYEGNGYTCNPIDPCSGNNCHENAKCFPIGESDYSCLCKNGYVGDGRNCIGSCKGRCGSYEQEPCRCVACDGFSSNCCQDYKEVCSLINPSFSEGFGRPRPQLKCQRPGLIDRGSHSGILQESFSVGSTITYTCLQGYSLDGARERTCSQSSFGFGEQPKWVPAEPTCGNADPCSGVICHPSSLCLVKTGEAVCLCTGQQWQCDSHCQKEPESYLDGELAMKSGNFAKPNNVQNLAEALNVEYDTAKYYIQQRESETASEHLINVAKLLEPKNLWTLGSQLQQQYYKSSDPLKQAMIAYFVGKLGDRDWAHRQFNFLKAVFKDQLDGPVRDVIIDIEQDVDVVFQEEGGRGGVGQQGDPANEKMAKTIEEEMEIIIRAKTAIGWSCSKDLVLFMGEFLRVFKPNNLSAQLKALLKKKLIKRNPLSRAIILYLLGKTDPAERDCSLRALEMIKKSVVGECRSFISGLITAIKKEPQKLNKADMINSYLKKIENLAGTKPEKACYFADQLLSLLSGMGAQNKANIVRLLESLLQNKNTNSDAVLRYLIAKLDPNKARGSRDKMVAIQTELKKRNKDYLVTKLLDNL